MNDEDGQPLGIVTRDALERMPDADSQSPVSIVTSRTILRAYRLARERQTRGRRPWPYDPNAVH